MNNVDAIYNKATEELLGRHKVPSFSPIPTEADNMQ